MAPSRCRFVVSACLAGEYCRYDGGSNACAAVRELVRRGAAVTACPEGLACLPVPRPPCEIREGRVLSQDGRDLTADFFRGARLAMEIARRHGCTAAILKEDRLIIAQVGDSRAYLLHKGQM